MSEHADQFDERDDDELEQLENERESGVEPEPESADADDE